MSARRPRIMGLAAHEKAPRPPPTFWTGNYKINWLSTTIVVGPMVLVALAVYLGIPLLWKTFIVGSIFYWLNGMLGITVGYHRMYSHRSFNPHPLVEMLVAFFGAGAFQGSIKWWSRNHRIHHRYIDTDKDPYNAKRGFFYTHVGWMLMKQDYSILGRVDISDLTSNWIVMSQHHYYLPIALFSGVIAPTAICGFGWGDWLGGYFYAAMAKIMFIHHCTFFINSLAHTGAFGATQNFSERHSSHDSMVCAFLTFGEGYHNFHHEFANDYRNGLKWYHFDPTKWSIRLFEILGLASNLVRTPSAIIEKGHTDMQLKKHQRALDELTTVIRSFEERTHTDAVWDWNEIRDRVASGEKLVVVGTMVLDLNRKISSGSGYTHNDQSIVWLEAHPGGSKILEMYVGKDATEAFTGGVYAHSEAAVNVLPLLRVAHLNNQS